MIYILPTWKSGRWGWRGTSSHSGWEKQGVFPKESCCSLWRSSTTSCRSSSGESYPHLALSPLCFDHSLSIPVFLPPSCLLALIADPFRKMNFWKVLPFLLSSVCAPTDVQAMLENQVSADTCSIIWPSTSPLPINRSCIKCRWWKQIHYGIYYFVFSFALNMLFWDRKNELQQRRNSSKKDFSCWILPYTVAVSELRCAGEITPLPCSSTLQSDLYLFSFRW